MKSTVLFRSIIAIVFLLFFSGISSATRFADYWTVDEYLEINSDQVPLSESFVDQVRLRPTQNYSENTPATIAVVYPGLQVSDYWKRSIKSFEQRLQEMGQKYVLKSHFTKPGQNVAEQSKKLGEFISQGADYLIFTLNVNRHKALIQKVMARKTTDVILQNITTPLKAFRNRQPFMYVGFDHAIGTSYLAEKYVSKFKEGAEYAIFYGPPGYVSDMRGGTFLELMQQQKGMELKASYYVGFNREKSKAAALQVIDENPNIKFIFSASTDIALGVIDAIKEKGKEGQIITNGWGGGSAELDAISRGELDFTVMRMNDDNGVAMAEAIVMSQMGRKSEVPTVYSGDMLLIDKEMSELEVGTLKKRAFRYSN